MDKRVSTCGRFQIVIYSDRSSLSAFGGGAETGCLAKAGAWQKLVSCRGAASLREMSALISSIPDDMRDEARSFFKGDLCLS
jgi:hypothetical protein